MLKKVVLIGLAILIPLGVADAKRNYERHRGNQAEQTQKLPEQLHKCVAITQDGSCWCSLSVSLDDAPSWYEGQACFCLYGKTTIDGHLMPESKIVAGTPICPMRPDEPQRKGTGIFKQMNP